MALLAIYLRYLTLDRLVHIRILINIMLKFRNYYTAIVKALEQVPHVSYLVRSTLTSTLRRSSTSNPFGSASSYARPSGLESGDPCSSSG